MSATNTTAVTAPVPASRRPAFAPLPWLLPIRPLQAALWEIAAIAVLLVFAVDGVSTPVRIGVMVAAGLLVLLTSARFGGRHLAGWASTWTGYRLRRTEPASPDPLHHLAGPVKVRQHVDRAGNRFGVAEVDGGWSAIVRLTPGPDVPDPLALVDILREAYRRPDIPLASAQLLTWAIPRGAEVIRVRWLAVRYRPDEAPIAALARGGGELGALRSTACAALSLMGTLAEAGYPSTVLEAGELAKELRVALGIQGPGALTERWRSCTWGDSKQVCFEPLSGRSLADTLDLTVSGAAFTATSYTMRRTPGGRERADLTVRVGVGAGDAVPSPGLSVLPLHGRHAWAIRRTLPLALED